MHTPSNVDIYLQIVDINVHKCLQFMNINGGNTRNYNVWIQKSHCVQKNPMSWLKSLNWTSQIFLNLRALQKHLETSNSLALTFKFVLRKNSIFFPLSFHTMLLLNSLRPTYTHTCIWIFVEFLYPCLLEFFLKKSVNIITHQGMHTLSSVNINVHKYLQFMNINLHFK